MSITITLVLLTNVVQAMNVGYLWSLSDSIPTSELEILKLVAVGSLLFLVIAGPVWLRNARQVGKVHLPEQKNSNSPNYKK